MTAPEGADVTEPTTTEPEPTTEPALPNVWRILPADVSDQVYMDTIEAMQQEIRNMPGVPRELVRGGVTPLEDGRWLAQAWQAKDRDSWEYPPVDPAEYQ